MAVQWCYKKKKKKKKEKKPSLEAMKEALNISESREVSQDNTELATVVSSFCPSYSTLLAVCHIVLLVFVFLILLLSVYVDRSEVKDNRGKAMRQTFLAALTLPKSLVPAALRMLHRIFNGLSCPLTS